MGQPVRDRAHLALLARLRARINTSLRWRTEVPLRQSGDLRAWDAVISGDDWQVAVEAETRAYDVQELTRRLALKRRDGDISHILVLLASTRHNRELVRSPGGALDGYPPAGALVLRRLAAGLDPATSSIVFL